MTLAAVASLHKDVGAGLAPAQTPDQQGDRKGSLLQPNHPTAQPPLFYTFAASFPDHPYPRLANADDPAELVIDVSAMLDKKEAAALCHKTQNALFVRRRSQEWGRPVTVREALLTVESLHRVFGSPEDELSVILT